MRNHRITAILLLCVLLTILLSSFSFGSAVFILDDEALPSDVIPLVFYYGERPVSFSLSSSLVHSTYIGLRTRPGGDFTFCSLTTVFFATDSSLIYFPDTYAVKSVSGDSKISIYVPYSGPVSNSLGSSLYLDLSFILRPVFFFRDFSRPLVVDDDGVEVPLTTSLPSSASSFDPSLIHLAALSLSASDPADPTYPAPSSDQLAQSRAIWEYKEDVKPSTYTLLYDIAINQGLALNTIADNSTELLKLLQNGVISGSGSGSSLIPMDIWAPDISDLPLHSAGGFIHDIWDSITNVIQSHIVNLDNYAGATYNYEQGMLQRFGFGSSIGMSEYNPVVGSSTRTVTNLGQALNTINDNIMYGGLIQNDFISRIEALYASDEDLAFQESQQDTVDAVKDDFFGDDPAFSPKTSGDAKAGVNGVMSGFSGGTDITFGQAVTVMGDVSPWAQFFTQSVADSLDTTGSAGIAVISSGGFDYIDSIDPSQPHVNTEPSFSDLYPDYVEGGDG